VASAEPTYRVAAVVMSDLPSQIDDSLEAPSVEAERELLAVVGHELRNPLQAVLFSAEALLGHGGMSEEQQRLAHRVLASARRSQRLVLELLDYSHLRAKGGLKLRKSRVDLHVLAREAMDEVRAAHPGRALSFDASGENFGEWDADRLSQVLTNLLVNALQHGVGTEPVKLQVIGEPEACRIQVRNSGAPIPPEVHDSLFDPYVRAGGPRPHTRGVGLGLFITHRIVRLHGGTISVSHAEGMTMFEIILPRVNALGG
jgi:phosphoserine phosphatase RsbU/P